MKENKIPENLKQLFDEFGLFGNKIAILAFRTDDKRQITFKELAESIQKLSAGLLKTGLQSQETVLLLAANSPEFIIAALSVIHAGGICVPVDAQSDDKVLLHIIEDSEAKKIFVDAKGLERWQKLNSKKKIQIIRLDNDEESDNWQKLLSDENNDSALPKTEDTAILFYTSGTTGLPKGVPLSHANIMMQIDAVIKTKLLNQSDRVLLPLPLFHVYPFVMGMLFPFSLGLNVILPKSITGPEIIRAIKESEATVLVSVPRLLRALYTAIETKARSNNISRTSFDTASVVSNFLCTYLGLNIGRPLFGKLHKRFPKLRLFACGGALLEPSLARKLIALAGKLPLAMD